MTHRKIFTRSLILLCCLLFTAVPHLFAQAPTITRNDATLDFPDSVTFHLELSSSTDIEQATLIYDLNQYTCLDVPSRVPVDVTGDVLEWQWVLSRSGNPPPGAELWWQWELVTRSGEIITTPRQTLAFTDDRFAWQVVSANGIHVHWYKGEDVGPILLDAAVSGLQTLENDMGIELQSDVHFYIYGTSQDMRDAVLYIQDWAGGVAFNEYNIILMGVSPDIAESWGRGTVRHELAHLVLGQFGRSCIGGHRPTWLEEGLAMVVEGDPDSQTNSDLQTGIENDSFAPLRSLNGAFPAHDAAASMAYSQSYSVVKFLLDTYGQESLQTFILTLAQGEGYDEALTAVYNFNIDGLETAWRASLGLPPRQIPPTPTPLTAAQIPTIAPQGVPQSVATPPAAAQSPPDIPAASSSVCGFGLIPLLLISGISRRKKNLL
ncbi:MAG: peptidase MA family metallohydrolase [Chloroflexota bacterium]